MLRSQNQTHNYTKHKTEYVAYHKYKYSVRKTVWENIFMAIFIKND